MEEVSEKSDRGLRAAAFLGFVLVFVGMMNNIPSIPGLDELVSSIVGSEGFSIRKYPYEWSHPFIFILMMLVVVFKHSFYRDIRSTPTQRRLGLAFDFCMLGASVLMAATYLIEIDSVCILDQVSGKRAELIAKSLMEEIEFAKLYGLPEPTSVEDPQCLATTGPWLIAIMAVTILIFLAYNVKVWGFPLVAVALLVVLYTLATAAVWYFYGADDIGKYLVTKLGGEPRQLLDGRPKIHDILVNNSSGLLGQFMAILLNTVFPFIILGSLFGASAGGQSLIRLAFRWTRKLNGGPAHAAIVSSAFFGTISGGPVVNVLSTGVLTIPMMIKRGFDKVFAGGVEAAASSGGQIMPPVMGVAAFILASLTQVPYREVIIAAIIPAVAYFVCLFLSVVFQARKQGIKAIGELTDDMTLNRQDKLNLLMIFLPILLILGLLLTAKEEVGCGFIGAMFGVVPNPQGICTADQLPWFFRVIQNSAGDAGSAGWWACILLIGLLFLDPKIRANPRLILQSLAQAGITISTLYLMFLSVSVIDFCLNLTGFSDYLARDILGLLKSLDISATGTPVFLAIALTLTMTMAVLLGMGMPSVPAYINVALLMGPMLAGLGIATFTAHMFIFFFAVASSITPPVAIAAFAAASITKAEPMATGFSAVRSGIVIFLVPFIFAFHPELLLIEAAVLNPDSNSADKYLTGYDGQIHIAGLLWLLTRLTLALYLISSALSRFDTKQLPWWEIGVRLVLATLVLSGTPMIYGPAVFAALGLIGLHYITSRRILA